MQKALYIYRFFKKMVKRARDDLHLVTRADPELSKMDGKGRATDNAIIERWFRTLKQKYIYLNPPETGLSLFH